MRELANSIGDGRFMLLVSASQAHPPWPFPRSAYMYSTLPADDLAGPLLLCSNSLRAHFQISTNDSNQISMASIIPDGGGICTVRDSCHVVFTGN